MRSKSYGNTDAQHGAYERNALLQAAQARLFATRALRSGDCGDAMLHLMAAMRHYGAAECNVYSRRKSVEPRADGDVRAREQRRLMSLRQAIMRVCVTRAGVRRGLR